MLFNFFLKNHSMSGVSSLEDIVRPITAGLLEGGHEVQFDYAQLLPRPAINILFEYFPDPRLIEEIQGAKDRLGDDLLLGLICTEDPADTISMGAKEYHPRLDNLVRALPMFDFVWSIVPTEDYDRLLDGRGTCRYLAFGHCQSLMAAPARVPSIDAILYGKLNRYRAPVVHRLLKAGRDVQATFGDMPEYIRYNMLRRTKLVLDMRRGDVVRYISPSRICAAIHNGSLVVAEDFDLTPEAEGLYRYTVHAPYDALADTALGYLEAEERRCEEARRLRELFVKETSQRLILDKLIKTIPGL